MTKLSNPPTPIQHGRFKFLVMDAPSDTTLPLYIKELEKNKVTDIVRVCNPSYAKSKLEQINIQVHDWPFEDGEAPPSDIIDHWLHLVNERFPVTNNTSGNGGGGSSSSNKKNNVKDEPVASSGCCIATHCVAGLGRAPVLVAIALIEDGMSALDAVAFIRERRKGAINNKQLKFLENYKRRAGRHKCLIS